jgi:hypothetical protein
MPVRTANIYEYTGSINNIYNSGIKRFFFFIVGQKKFFEVLLTSNPRIPEYQDLAFCLRIPTLDCMLGLIIILHVPYICNISRAYSVQFLQSDFIARLLFLYRSRDAVTSNKHQLISLISPRIMSTLTPCFDKEK